MEEKKKTSKVGDILFVAICILIVILFIGQKWLGWTW